jgi:Na+-transporting methylmalonyl-CoA/oxaloacetate decarboxylase gamma subunit
METGFGLTGMADSTYDTVLTIVVYGWGVVFIIIVLVVIVWAYMHSIKRDSESYGVEA